MPGYIQKSLKKIENPNLAATFRRVDSMPDRYWLKIERRTHDAHIHFAQKLQEMP